MLVGIECNLVIAAILQYNAGTDRHTQFSSLALAEGISRSQKASVEPLNPIGKCYNFNRVPLFQISQDTRSLRQEWLPAFHYMQLVASSVILCTNIALEPTWSPSDV